MTVPSYVRVTAPGRICLFGEHQDFLGLPVIACAIALAIEITGSARTDSIFHLDMPDINQTDEFDAAEYLEYRHSRDYLRAAVNILQRKGLVTSHGYDCTVSGAIPINAGTAGSSALVVAWTAFLLATQEHNLPAEREDIAAYAHEAEVIEFGEPGGMMDHYTSALGGVLYMRFDGDPLVESLRSTIDGLVVGDSGVRKATTEVLAQSRQAAQDGFEWLAQRIDDFKVRTTPLAEVEPLLPDMPEQMRRCVRAQLINRDLCQQAYPMLKAMSFDRQELGEMLLDHQRHLREGIGVSHSQLDRLIGASVAAGALGGKLNGSGCGGAMFAYAPEQQQQVKKAIERVGGTGYITSVRDGVTVEVE